MRTTDWNYDFSSLHRWEDREKLWDAYDEFHEIPDSDLLCCLYSIAERRMLDYRGYLAILRNKKEPELLLNISEYTFCQTFFLNERGSLIFLQPCVHIQKLNQTFYPVLILDIVKNRFSCALLRNTVGICKITQNKQTVFDIELSGRRSRKIRSRWLKWHPLEQLPMLPHFW
jgi:hypothetical protein